MKTLKAICTNCVYHKYLNYMLPPKCSHPEVRGTPIQSPVTGNTTFVGRASSVAIDWETGWPLCSDINTAGDCPHHKEKVVEAETKKVEGVFSFIRGLIR